MIMVTRTPLLLKVEPVQYDVQHIQVQCAVQNIHHTDTHAKGVLVESVLRVLGLSSKVIVGQASPTWLAAHASINVLMFVEWVEGEDVPVVNVYHDGTNIGCFTVDAFLLPDEMVCVGTLNLLGYDVTLDDVALF